LSKKRGKAFCYRQRGGTDWCVRFQTEQSVKNGLILGENVKTNSYYLKTSYYFNIINT